MGIRKKKNFLFLVKGKKKTVTMDQLNGSDILLQIDFKPIRVATGDFSDKNKIGQGGFGAVYKGSLPNGKEIAVKRLSMNSGQGGREFMKEVEIIPMLQHRNLVQLYGYCVKVQEKLLVYEYMPNGSLAYFLFDPDKRPSLDWERRFKIIGGISRGLLYLHEDSRLRIIHRDLKASNILLDANMIPRITDFGLAKIIGGDQTSANTRKIAGTFGYMAPEYAMHGQFSVKSDVYSFGVLLLEIISGRKAFESHRDGYNIFLIYDVWKAWNGGTISEIIDSSISELCSRSEVVRCIHIGLLCVQEDATLRPFMSSVVMMLTNSSLAMPAPSTPAYFNSSTMEPTTQVSLTENHKPAPSTASFFNSNIVQPTIQVSLTENHTVSSSRNSLVGSIRRASFTESFTTVHATLY